MKILLIKPPWHCLQNIPIWYTPIGLGYIAAVLRENGYACAIFDSDLGYGDPQHYEKIVVDHELYRESLQTHPVWQKLQSVIEEYKPDLCGISMSTGSYGAAKKVAKIVKEINKNTLVAMGGPHPTLLPEDVLQDEHIDVAVRGEGERTFLELVRRYEQHQDFSQVKGISYRLADGSMQTNSPREFITDLDTLPFPAKDLILEKEKYIPSDFGSIITSRGCPYRCTFCASYKIWSRQVRFRSPENIVAEIIQAHHKYGTESFHFNDDTFTVNKNRIMKFCALLRQKKLSLRWRCDVRVDTLNESILKEMKKAGCVQINVGVESGNPEILNSIQKNIDLDQVRDIFKIAKNLGIGTYAYFMVGFPGETKQQVQETIELMKEIKPTVYPCWSICTPYPGTEIFETIQQMKLLPEQPDWSEFYHHSTSMNFSNIPDNEFKELLEQIGREVTQIQRQAARLSLPKRIRKKFYQYVSHPASLLADAKSFSRKTLRKIKGSK